MKNRPHGILVGCCMAVVSSTALVLAADIPDASRVGTTGARLLPVACSVLMLAFALATLVSAIMGRGVPAAPGGRVNRLGWAAAVILLFVYSLVLERAGFLVATFALLAALSPFFGLGRPGAALAWAFAATVGIWLLFTRALGAYLPTGTVL